MTSTESQTILFIGDSFATPEAAKRLAEALERHEGTSVKRYQVVRLGYPGMGLAHFLPEVRRYVEQSRPDIVIHIYPDTDASRHYSLLKRLVFPTPRLAIKAFMCCWLLSNRLRRIHATFGDRTWGLLEATILRDVEIRNGLKMDCKLFQEFAAFLGERRIRYIVCLWDIANCGLTSRFRRSLEFLSTYSHARFLPDLNDYLALFHEWEYKIPNDIHPNDLGNRLMARYIVTKGVEAGFL
jgi:hypothetical protein